MICRVAESGESVFHITVHLHTDETVRFVVFQLQK